MSYDLHVVKSTDFVRLDAKGNVDFEESRRVLSDLARTCFARGIDRALLDIRKVPNATLKLAEVYALARTFGEMGFQRHQRVAVLHSYSSTDRADFFVMCTADQGFDISAFDQFEDAAEWLSRPEVEMKIPVQ